MPKKIVTKQMIEKMKKLRKKGLTYQKIAAQLGVSTMTVYNYLRKKTAKKRSLLARLLGRS